MLTYVLYGIFILSCIVLIVSVLVQPGKADAGALFSSSISSAAFGPRGTQTLLAKITIGAASAFMLAALALSLPFVTGSRSVVAGDAEEQPAQPQASPAASPAANPAGAPDQSQPNTNAAAPDSTNTAAPPAPAASPAASEQSSPAAASPQGQTSPAQK